jgi:TonB family protein
MRQFWIVALLLSLGTAKAQQPSSTTDADNSAKSDIRPPRLLNHIEAEYPMDALKKGSGMCLVALIVNAEGGPENVHVVRCTDPVFAKNSLSAASKYRFAPSTRPDGAPVQVSLSVEVTYRLDAGRPEVPIRCGFKTPPDTTSTAPDAAGVYPLTKLLDPPAMIGFADEGYGMAAFRVQGVGACDVVLKIDEKGKASDVGTVHCEKEFLDNPASESLLKSRYKPARLNGKPVPVRVSVHLELGEASSVP